jgi:hypothetical protein
MCSSGSKSVWTEAKIVKLKLILPREINPDLVNQHIPLRITGLIDMGEPEIASAAAIDYGFSGSKCDVRVPACYQTNLLPLPFMVLL